MRILALVRTPVPFRFAVAALTLAVGACAVVQPATRTRTPAPAAVLSPANVPPLNVPPGHYPAVGMCRVWIHGRPPGRQARPVACSVALANAPAGSWVLYRATASEVHARIIDPRRAGVVINVNVYEAEGGRYVRNQRP